MKFYGQNVKQKLLDIGIKIFKINVSVAMEMNQLPLIDEKFLEKNDEMIRKKHFNEKNGK